MNKIKSKKPPVSKDQISQLFELISTTTKGTNSICQEIGICFGTVWKMINTSKPLIKRYARAKEEQAGLSIETINERIKTGYECIYSLKHKGKALHPKQLNALVTLIKVDVDSIKWIGSKLLPTKYGDKLELSGSKDHSLWPKKVSVEIVKPVQKASRNKVKTVRN